MRCTRGIALAGDPEGRCNADPGHRAHGDASLLDGPAGLDGVIRDDDATHRAKLLGFCIRLFHPPRIHRPPPEAIVVGDDLLVGLERYLNRVRDLRIHVDPHAAPESGADLHLPNDGTAAVAGEALFRLRNDDVLPTLKWWCQEVQFIGLLHVCL